MINKNDLQYLKDKGNKVVGMLELLNNQGHIDDRTLQEIHTHITTLNNVVESQYTKLCEPSASSAEAGHITPALPILYQVIGGGNAFPLIFTSFADAYDWVMDVDQDAPQLLEEGLISIEVVDVFVRPEDE